MGHLQRGCKLLCLAGALLGLMPLAVAAEPFPDKLELLSVLRSGDYAELDARLVAYQERFEAGALPEDRLISALFAFANSDPELERPLNQWNGRFPESYAAALARGTYYWSIGWHSRGTRYASKTSEESFEAMDRYFALATADFTRALEINARASAAYGFLISIANASAGERAEDRLLRSGLEAVPRSAFIRWRYLNAQVPWWGGSLDRIRALVERTMREHPDDPALRVLQGYPDLTTAEIWRRDDKGAAAVQYYDRALRFGESWWYRYRRGHNSYRLGRYEEALSDLNRALELRPQVADVLDLRARVYRRQDRLELALADWAAALAIDPYDPTILRNRGSALWDEGRHEEALADYDKALVYGGNDHGLRAARGRLHLYALKNYDLAAADLERATQLAPNNANHWYNYSVALYHTRDCAIANALKTYRRLCESSGKCDDSKVTWAKGSLRHFARTGECPLD